MTEYVPNISIPQKRVKILMPSNSKLSKSTKPKTAQNSVCIVSNKLHGKRKRKKKTGKKKSYGASMLLQFNKHWMKTVVKEKEKEKHHAFENINITLKEYQQNVIWSKNVTYNWF